MTYGGWEGPEDVKDGPPEDTKDANDGALPPRHGGLTRPRQAAQK